MRRGDSSRRAATAAAAATAGPEWHRDAPAPALIAPAALAAASALVGLWPFTAVIEPGRWSITVLAVTIAVVGTGALLRHLLRFRPPALRDAATLLAQLAVAGATLTLLIAADGALLGLIPTSTTVTRFSALIGTAGEQILYGSAPLEATSGLAAALGLGFAIVAVLLDHLIAHRSAVLAIMLTAGIGAVPMIVTAGDPHIVWFVMLGILALIVLRWTATRDPRAPGHRTPALAAGAGAAALAAALVVSPALPVSAGLVGTGVGVSVNASLRLGDDLRRPNPIEVLTIATDRDTAPYLRLATLSQFDGRIWHPDTGEVLAQGEGFGAPEWGDDIASAPQSTSIRVLRMSSAWLPVPYPATDVQGIGAEWRLMPANRTVVSRTADAVGNDYTVSSQRLTPTLEQIRALDAAPPLVDPEAEPIELPESIARLAAEVTSAATTDYDRLIALQSWFRSEFAYSLDTPVEEGFDGSGAEAVDRFLELRSGYCVHFAGAFALMAESLGMKVRIVVGYLPGAKTDEKRGDESVFTVSSDQLHSWPEVEFPGIGWVPFEPTASLGVPTAFQPGSAAPGVGGGTNAPAPTTSPTDGQTTAPEADRADTGDASGFTGGRRALDPAPIALVTLGALVVLALPALLRVGERMLRLRRARRGDAAAAWAELRDTLIDLRLPLSDADTPRVRASGLVQARGVDPRALRRLTDAVELANYARAGAEAEADLSPAVREVLHDLRRSVDARSRVGALLLPRSLFASRAAAAPIPV